MTLKRTLSLVLALMLFGSVSVSAKTLEFTMNEKVVYESDAGIESFEIENAPYTKNGRTMVPARIISERFGASVEWLAETNQVVIAKDGKTITLTLGSKEAIVNGQTVALDAAPEEFNGRTMVPVRFISETLGMDVEYVESTQQILITDEPVIMTINGIDVNYSDYQAAMAFLGYVPDQGNTRYYVDFVTEAFKQIYGSSTYLNIIGIYPPEAYSKEVDASLAPYKQEIYKVALAAPIAKLLAHDYFLADFVYSYVDTEEAFDDALSTYEAEFITAKHILILSDESNKAASLEKAQEILNVIKSGEDFDALMNEYNEDPGMKQYPNGYTFTKGQMVPEFEEAAFALKEGQVSDIIETDYGYHIIKREHLAEIDHRTLEYVMEMVADSLYQKIATAAVSNAQVQVYMTPEEIVALFEK